MSSRCQDKSLGEPFFLFARKQRAKHRQNHFLYVIDVCWCCFFLLYNFLLFVIVLVRTTIFINIIETSWNSASREQQKKGWTRDTEDETKQTLYENNKNICAYDSMNISIISLSSWRLLIMRERKSHTRQQQQTTIRSIQTTEICVYRCDFDCFASFWMIVCQKRAGKLSSIGPPKQPHTTIGLNLCIKAITCDWISVANQWAVLQQISA